MKEFVAKLIERLSNACDECIGWNHHKVNAYGHAIKIVNQLAEEYKGNLSEKLTGWIPVTERLPEDGDNRFYMCIVENHEEDVPMFCQYCEDHGFGFWHDFYDEHTLGFLDLEFKTNEELGYEKVIAWQSLPDPYKPEEKPKFSNEELDRIMDKILDNQDLDKVKQEPKTRIEHIRSMSVEELADKIMENEELYVALKFCRNYAKCWEEVNEDECRKCLIKWLNSLVEQKKVIPTEHFKERFNKVL